MASEQKPPNYRDIALKARVSVASVSLGLRNDPRISAPVRARIKEIAKEMGYRPNPLLSAYQASVRSKQPATFRATLGWINDHPDQNAWRKPWMQPIWDGARARAQELGYELDEIWFPEIKVETPEENVRKIQKILHSRGIAGVILPSLERAQHAVQPWEGFTVVCIGEHHLLLESSKIQLEAIHEHHKVNSNYLYNIHLAFWKLRKIGCERIGLAISGYADQESDYAYSSSFLRGQFDVPAKRRVPILFSNATPDVTAWAKKHRPDAVICNHSDVLGAVKKAGFKVPQDVKIAHLNLATDVAGLLGVDRRMDLLGSAAVDMLTAHLIRNETGVPPYAKAMSIQGVWVGGDFFLAGSTFVKMFAQSRRDIGAQPVVPTLSFLHNFFGIILKND